jgi:hypothetical protein
MLLILAFMAGLAALWFHEQTELAESYPLNNAKVDYYKKLKWRCYGVFLVLGAMHFFVSDNTYS